MMPQASPSSRLARFSKEIESAIGRVLRSRTYVLGPEVEAFENAFATYTGAAAVVGVANGTDALILALRAIGAGPGRAVVTSAMSASATATAIALTGAEIVFADIDAETRCLDPRSLEAAITRETVAIVPVHLYGQSADMTEIMRVASAHDVIVVEDCAQAHGAMHYGQKVGTFGALATYSFYPTKNLGCMGDGGAIAVNDPALIDRLLELRQYGWRAKRGDSCSLGYNSRLDEVQAAILSVLLPHLDAGNKERRLVASSYRAVLSPLVAEGRLRLPKDDPGCVYHQFAIELSDRADVVSRLHAAGVGTAVHYEVPLHRQAAFAKSGTAAMPNAEKLALQTLSLPIQSEVVGDRAHDIAMKICKAMAT